MSVDEHPFKVVVDATESSPGIPERGWVDMDVRWLVTKDNLPPDYTKVFPNVEGFQSQFQALWGKS